MATWKLFLVDSFPQVLLTILVFAFKFQIEDFTYFKANPLQLWEILGIYAVVFFFIFKNVIPKFVSFGGARRHYNDVKSVEKKGLAKFMTKNYIRLFMHILSGATQVLLSGAYVIAPQYWNTIFSFGFLKYWFIFWDIIHETTGFLMTRNHDGIFAIRAFNLAFMVVKLFFCGQIYEMDSVNEDFITLVGGLFILTSGFAWVRFTCSIIAIAQCWFYTVDMTLLRENWYSLGLWLGQFLIAWRCHVLGLMHVVFFFCAIYFPVELWIKKRAHFRDRNIFVTSFLAAAYFIRSEQQNEIHLVLSVAFLVYTSCFSGLYWKRAPIPGVDFDETKMTKEEIKQMNLRRSMSYRGVLPSMVSNFVAGKKKMKKYNKSYHDFIRTRSSSRAPLRAPCMMYADSQGNDSGQAGKNDQQQQLMEILKQNENLSKEELAALILRQLHATREATLPEVFSDMEDDHKQSGAPFKHPMADGPSGTPDIRGDHSEVLAATPGHFSCSRSVQRHPTDRLKNPRIRDMSRLASNKLDLPSETPSKSPSTRNHFHY